MHRTASFLSAFLALACAATASKPAEAPPTEAPAAGAPAVEPPEPRSSTPSTSSASNPTGMNGSLPEASWLPSEAREMLHARMARHGEEMMLLLLSVMMLQNSDTEVLAEQVAADTRLGRPAAGEKGTISELLPPRFFTLQDQLVERADALAAGAREGDTPRIVHAYGQLVETCVSCHSVYLQPDQTFEGLED